MIIVFYSIVISLQYQYACTFTSCIAVCLTAEGMAGVCSGKHIASFKGKKCLGDSYNIYTCNNCNITLLIKKCLSCPVTGDNAA